MNNYTKIANSIQPYVKINMFSNMMARIKNILNEKKISYQEYKYVRLQIIDTEYYDIFYNLYENCGIYSDAASVRYGTQAQLGTCSQQDFYDRILIYNDNDMSVYSCSDCGHSCCIIIKLSLKKFQELMFENIINLN